MRLPDSILRECRFLAGPTGCGKSAIALGIAEKLEAEILSLDSMAIYRGMDVGTAKPVLADRRRVPHHLIDLADPWEDYSVADYLIAARGACEEIVSRGRIPLFVGGTGLYLRSLLRGIFSGPPADEVVRARLERRYDEIGGEAFHAELAAVDPTTANRVHPRDARRLVRAREVYELTGQPLSSFHDETPLPVGLRPEHVVWLRPPRDWLYERINARVDAMLHAGLLDEVEALRRLPRPLGKTARQAIGYKELLDALESGASLEAAVELIRSRSRQLARRQHTWFRHLDECRPFDISGEESTDELVDALAVALR